MKKIIHYFEKIDSAVSFLSNLSIITMLILISADTLGRYVFNSPITGTYEIVTMYLFAGVVFFGLSNGLKEKSHISVSVVVDMLPCKIRKVVSAITNIIMLAFFAALFYVSWLMTYEALVIREYYYGAVSFPLFPAYAILPIGCLLMIGRVLINMFQSVDEKEGVDLN